jgi:hypothetical protein
MSVNHDDNDSSQFSAYVRYTLAYSHQPGERSIVTAAHISACNFKEGCFS